jgi:hypothetical protein
MPSPDALPAARAALLFLRRHHRDDLVVAALLGDGARAGRVAVGPDAIARVGAGLEQQPRHLDIARHHRDVERADFEAGRSAVQQIDDFRPAREQRTHRAEVALFHGLVQPLRRDPLDGGLQLRPALEPVRARQDELCVVQGERVRCRRAMVDADLEDSIGRLRAIRLQQLPGLPPQLIDIGVLAHGASGRVRVNGHDELLSRPCRRHSLRARRPLSRAGKEIILT